MADLKGDAQAKVGRGNPSNPKGDVIKSDLYGNKLGGNEWDDGQHWKVKKIIAIVEDDILTVLQLHYVDDAKVTVGAAHGSTKLEAAKYLNLDQSNEVLQKITGYYGKHDNIVKIKSLTFKTNIQEFPTVSYAAASDSKFEIPSAAASESKKEILGSNIIGLFGRADDKYVYAIGAYYYEA